MMARALSSAWFVAWISAFAAAVAANKNLLTELDAAIGDADHGANLDRGLQAVLARLPTVDRTDVGAILKTVGMTLISTVGGASGPLYGTLFLRMASALPGASNPNLSEVAAALKFGVEGVMARGKASAGDKTMIDALAPAASALEAAALRADSPAVGLAEAAAAAERGALSTVPLVARKGRASYLGERSAGHQDPGATSAALLLRAAAEVTPVEPG